MRMTMKQIQELIEAERQEKRKENCAVPDILKLNFAFPSMLFKRKHMKVCEVSVQEKCIAGVCCQIIKHAAAETKRKILYLHGGAFVCGDIEEYIHFCAALSERSKCEIVFPEYRLAPKNPFPAAPDDCLNVYKWMAENCEEGEKIFIAGDSAGATLSLATVFQVIEQNIRIPDALISICASVDEERNAASWKLNRDRDFILGIFAENLVKDKGRSSVYLQGHSTKDKLASPIHGEFQGFPPVLIQVSNMECLRDDSLRLYLKMCDAGVCAELDIYDKVPHVWHLYTPFLKEADDAIDKISEFLRKRG